jgi:hypothetical protein
MGRRGRVDVFEWGRASGGNDGCYLAREEWAV